ncbi:hypothetical protein PC9H_008154 [Pleurotus ostreatus]|uniref:Uncharacterized protein n=1 Tax=Pleurotus ostreatus TaxID=5322 RepID=A0A8H6ZW96_PLEOS|nr:uncharacterized protein PC9H_008154 [Pleurotus ostreatus]KAF7428918.1 hypothetical protein PC9H_008154 [Pleurotus ostreatus]KAJ8697178.1 hypothetical protein PTI98_006978 [Pleurotus ostreatus]
MSSIFATNAQVPLHAELSSGPVISTESRTDAVQLYEDSSNTDEENGGHVLIAHGDLPHGKLPGLPTALTPKGERFNDLYGRPLAPVWRKRSRVPGAQYKFASKEKKSHDGDDISATAKKLKSKLSSRGSPQTKAYINQWLDGMMDVYQGPGEEIETIREAHRQASLGKANTDQIVKALIASGQPREGSTNDVANAAPSKSTIRKTKGKAGSFMAAGKVPMSASDYAVVKGPFRDAPKLPRHLPIPTQWD